MTAPTKVRNRQQNEGWRSVLEWLKFYCIKFFGGQQEGEIKLLAQFYNRLRAEYEKIKQDESIIQANPHIVSEIEKTFSERKESQKSVYYIEGMLTALYPEEQLNIKLERKIVEAKNLLEEEVYSFYEKKQKEENISKRTLLSDLITDLQWFSQNSETRRVYVRTARVRMTLIFILSFVVFFLPNILGYSAAFWCHLGGPRAYFLSTAITASALGATFSMLIGLKDRLKDSTLEGLIILHRWSYITSRAIIGVGAGLVLFYLIQSELIQSTVMPAAITGNALLPSVTSVDLTQEEVLNKCMETTWEYKDVALLIIFSFIAGFSEKFVPDMLSQTEQRTAVSDADQT